MIGREGLENPADLFASRFGLGQEVVRRILARALSKGGEFAELYAEYHLGASVNLEDGNVKDTSEGVSLGAGVRVISGEQTGYGYTNDLAEAALLEVAETAAAIAARGSAPAPGVADLRVHPPRLDLYDPTEASYLAPLKARLDLCLRAHAAASGVDTAVKQIRVGFGDSLRFLLIANSEGLFTWDVRPMVRLDVSVVAERGGRRESGYHGNGGRVGLSYFEQEETPEAIGRKAAEESVLLLQAVDPPAGEMPVVLAPGESGTMIHEAVGHLLEADANRKRQSIFWDKMGQKVANANVTIFDDPTIPRFRGSYNVDDEGTEPRKTLLIERGVLRGYLMDRLSAKVLGMALTGHGRRENYQHVPIPRMSNTYLAAGEWDPQEILASVKRGLYAVSYQGGQVEDTGKFTFSLSLAYLIENGRLTAPVRQATLIGSNLDILQKIEMVGNDLKFSRQTGTCGKEGQSVPVTDGTPTVKIQKMTVGGKA